MPSLRNLVPVQRTLNIDFGDGETVNIVYDPRQITYTPEEIEARREDDAVRNANAEDLAKAVISWDVTGPVPTVDRPGRPAGSLVPEGQVIPLDAGVLGHIEFEVLSTLIMAITMDGQPDPKRMEKRLQRLGSTKNS